MSVCQQVSDMLRESLIKIPMFHYVRQGSDFILDTTSIPIVLSQLDDQGREIPFVFASKILGISRQWYCTMKWELYATAKMTNQLQRNGHGLPMEEGP